VRTEPNNPGAGPAGDPDTLVTIRSVRTEFEGGTIAAVLEDSGVRARVFATTANWVGWEGGIGNSVRVQVRRADAERAEAVLRKNRQDSVDLDWDQVDVGQMEDVGAEARPNFSMERVLERRRGRARVVRIGMILIGATMIVSQLGPASALPIGAMACLMVWAYWDGVGARGSAAVVRSPRTQRDLGAKRR
jgi:hypothetical protein